MIRNQHQVDGKALFAMSKIVRQTFREDIVDSFLQLGIGRQGLQDRHGDRVVIRTSL